eukprot:3139869-Alexandrium_andersonii.AAC.1
MGDRLRFLGAPAARPAFACVAPLCLAPATRCLLSRLLSVRSIFPRGLAWVVKCDKWTQGRQRSHF